MNFTTLAEQAPRSAKRLGTWFLWPLNQNTDPSNTIGEKKAPRTVGVNRG